jgi:Caspase domain
MMDNQHSVVTHYAILIGINAYQDKPLTCCVRDVQRIKEYLEGVSNPIHVQMFTASESIGAESSSPTEDLMLWPTYDNITSALSKITSLAKYGDFVYIHYSGHGTRGEPEPDDEFSNKDTGDLALVLLNRGKENHVRYLWGLELALSLKAMVDKGLVVTLVLDCCFSATIYRRDDPSVRFLPYDAEVSSRYPLDILCPEKSLEHGAGIPASRDASMLPNWLLNPDGYAILTACGPHEEAMEFESKDGERHGALSYFLLLTWIKLGGLGKKHKDVYDHLRAEFRESWRQQHPVFYGNKDQGFFGHVDSGIGTATIPIIKKQDGSLELQAGKAHGVYDGDGFVVYLMSSTELDSESEGNTMEAKVIHARALTSDLKPLNMTATHVEIKGTAKALTRSSFRKFPIRLAADLPYRDKWLTVLQERSLYVHNDDGNQCSFHIILDSSKEYRILDKSGQKIINLPIMTQDQTRISSVCEIMEHLAKFELARDLANMVPADRFRESFSAKIILSGDAYDPGSLVEVEHDEEAKLELELRVENKGNKDLYIYIYNLGPCWHVQNILYGSYKVIPPKNGEQGFTGTFKKKLKTVVPSEMRSHRQCEDIIKVFVTSQPTSFDLLELPRLGGPVKKDRSSRSSHDGGSPSSEDWAALNFLVRTCLK